jgi:transposase
MKKGAPWLKTTLVQCAWAAARTKGSYFQAQYHRLRSRRGPKKAIGALASSLLTAVYHMLKSGTLYQDLGANHFNHRAKEKQALHLIHRLKNLAFNVQITPSVA